MGDYTIAGKNVMLDALGAVASHIAILNNAGTPAQIGDRIALEGWDAASDGEMDAQNLSGQTYVASFPVGEGVTVKYIALYSAGTDGTEYSRKDLGEDAEEFTNAGNFQIDSATLNLLMT